MLTSIIWDGMMNHFYVWRDKQVWVDHSISVETLEKGVRELEKAFPLRSYQTTMTSLW